MALLLLLSACGDAGEQAAPEEVTDPDQPDFGYDPSKYLKGGQASQKPGGAPAPAKAPTGGTTSQRKADEPAPKGPTDTGTVGQNSFFYLNASVPKLVIEIDAVQGYEPSKAAVDLLATRLKSIASKPGGIQVVTNVVGGGRPSWTVAHVRQFEQQHRSAKSTPSSAVIHVSYVDGESVDGAIGIAYASSSVVLFAESLRANALATVPAEDVEKSVLVHEVGHLLALVNIGYTSPRDHEDDEHRGHSKNIGSVMYYAVDTVGVYSVFRGLNRLPPTDFDADDRADLADIKTRKIRPG